MHKIIDGHSHLGDIFAYKKNVINDGIKAVDPNKYDPFSSFSKKGFEGAFLDPTNPAEVQNVIDMTYDVSFCNTLANLTRDLDEAGVDHVCLFPMAPYVNFEDYRLAALVEPRILPFTSVNWGLRDAEALRTKALEDYRQGAYGLKIHPILQSIDLHDPLVEEVLNAWAPTELPVVSHCGANSYYPEDVPEFKTQMPRYGELEDFMYLVKKMPHVNFISAHAGGLSGGEMEILASELAGAANLWVDTTFRSADQMKTLVKLFGEDRVIFGVDRPFGLTKESVDTAFNAFGKDTPLSQKVMYENMAKLIKLI